MSDTRSDPSSTVRGPTADIGAGDPEAAAGAIPNLIAGLIETETWRNAATVLLGTPDRQSRHGGNIECPVMNARN